MNESVKKIEGLVDTRKAFDAFIANRTVEGYKEVLKSFVFEVMTTERAAAFPTTSQAAMDSLEGKAPFSSVIVRDANGLPYLAFLTGADVACNGAEVSVEMKASTMLINVMGDGALAGVALNPWTGGGVSLPKNLLFDEINKLSKQLLDPNERTDKMTINMAYYENKRRMIASAGIEQIAEIKKELAERLRDVNYAAPRGEDPTLVWNLYLDTLCNMRLGAVAWDGGAVVALSAGELDLLADWYEALCEVARSVNRRQQDGRGGCNAAKFDVLHAFVADNARKIEGMVGRNNGYARYLQERTAQVENMHAAGAWRRIEKVDALRGNYFL